MNRNYKVIWNASLNCFMAVSEYAKARGKSSKSSVSSNATINTTSTLSSTRIFRITTIWLGLVTAGFSMQAIAVPCDASTEIKCGINATTGGLHGIAVGKNATVLGSQGIAIGGGSSGQNTTASGEQSIAIGANVVSSGASSIAIGGDDLDAASKTNFDGSTSTGPLNSGEVNTTFNEYAGRDLLESWDAYGGHTEASGAASIAMGAKARSAGNLATAIGIHSSAAGTASSAFGVGSSAAAKGSLALGAGAQSIIDDGVALGSRSVANVAGGALGFAPTSASVIDKAAITATNSTSLGAVSLGNAKEGNRQIVNLAAGTKNSDAVNVAQLKGGISSVVDLGLNFTGDNTATAVNRKIGEKLTVKGGESDATKLASGNNIGVMASSPDTLTVKLAKNLTGLTSVTTGNTVMNTSGISFTGSTVNLSGTGLNNGGNQIKNVASGGTTLTNAANIGDVQSTVAANKTKYYSVNSTGGTNDDNLGASGQNAMAMGRNSVASGSQAISIGSGASGQKTTASGEQSIAIGANTVSKGASSIAIGGDDLDAASKANLTGAASGTVNGGSVNTTFKAYTGRDLVETPPYQVNTESGGAASIAMGAKALSQGALSTAIGVQSSTTGVASSALGMGSSAMKEGSVALGAGSVANVAGGMVGYVPLGATNSAAITATQSGARFGAVSVGTGDKGGNRQIVNLAAGTKDSDAVNVAQLKGGVSSVVDLGLNFTGDNTATTVNRKLGEKLTVKGGATTALSDNNIGVEATSPGTLTVKLAKNIDLGKTGSVKMGTSSPFGLGPVTTVDRLGMNTGNSLASTNVNGLGVFVNGPLGIPSTALTMDGVNIIGGPSVTRSGGVDAGNKRITRVSNGINPTDAVNVSQLTGSAAGSKTEVEAGTNVAVTNNPGTNGQNVYTINADGTTASAGSDAVTVTTGTKDTITNLTDYAVDLSQASKDSLGKADNSVQYDNSARTSVTLGGAGATTPVALTNIASGNLSATSTDAVNGSQLFETNTKVNKGFGLKAADGNTVVKQLGDQVEVVGSNSNITTKVVNGKVAVDLNNNLDLGKTGSVKMGNTTVSKDGMTIVAPTLARTVVLNSAGLNNGGNKITNVKAGTEDMDAVNVSQLNLANTTIDKGLNFGGDSGTDVNRKLGQKLIVKGGDTVNADPATKNISVTANGDDTLTVRLAKDINLGNMGSVTTGNTQVNNAGITLYNGDNDQVVLTNNGLNNGNNKITNVADGLLSATSTDGVNGSQLFKTNQDVAKGIKFELNGTTKTYALGEAIQVATDANITTTAFGNGAKFGLADTIKIGGTSANAVSIDGSAGIVKGLTNTTFDSSTTYTGGQAATQEQLSGLQNGISNTFDKGISFGGDNAPTTIKRKLGEKIIVKGGVSDPTKLTDSNIGVIADGTDTLTVKLAKDLTGLNSASFGNDIMISSTGLRAGATVINTGGVSFSGSTVGLSSSGLNNGGKQITNVARGEATTDAVNVGQLNEVKQSAADANKGWNVSAQGANTSAVKPSDTVDLNNTDNNITVSKTAESNNVSFNLSKDIAVDSVKTGDATMNSSGLTIVGGPKFTKTSVDAGGNKITNVAKGDIEFDSNDAVNGSQLFEFLSLVNTQTTVIAEMGAGLNFNADSGPVINKKAGSTPLTLKGGKNITTTSENGSIKFDLNGNINVDSVTTGDTTVSTNGVVIAGGPSITKTGIYAGNGETAPSMTAAGINAAGTKVTNVADGMAPRDAVNFGQLDAVSRGLGNSINELGYKIGEVEDDANAGISAAMAMSSLPQAYIIGKPMIGGGIATFNGESAVAIGFSKMSNDGRWVMKLNGTADTQGNVGGAIGAGFHFD